MAICKLDCSVVGCENKARCMAGEEPMCSVHYGRWRNNGTPFLADRRASKDGRCTVDGCSNAIRSANSPYCEMHYGRMRRNSPLGMSLLNGTCLHCGAELIGERLKFCSTKCNSRYSNNISDYKECVICSSLFATNGVSVTCSEGCNRERIRRKSKRTYSRLIKTEAGKARIRQNEYKRKALKTANGFEDFNPHEIFCRDAWKCQLCGERVNRRVKWPHPRFPTLDHIIPLSRGGSHTKINVQCAHLSCNLSKHAGPGGQLRLFA